MYKLSEVIHMFCTVKAQYRQGPVILVHIIPGIITITDYDP